MPIDVQEKFSSRRIRGQSVEVSYLILGTDDESAALLALLNFIPATWGNAPLQLPDIEQIGDLIWEAECKWSFETTTPQEVGDETLSFSTKGGKSKITQSRGTTRYAKAGEVAPNFMGQIGVTKDHVEGTEITIPTLTISKTRRFVAAWLTPNRLKELASLTGTTNAEAFMAFAAGELLFEGCTGSQKNPDEDVDVTFDFLASQNVTDQTFGDITGIAKNGWQYLWFLTEDTADGAAMALVKRPKAAYVETVYPSSNFGAIGVSG